MKTKLLQFTTLVLALAGSFSSCNKDELSPQETILGRWQIIADGPSANEMYKRTEGSFYDFFSDGTLIVSPGGTFTYTIASDLLVCRSYYDDGEYSEKSYKLSFGGNKLKLVDTDFKYKKKSEVHTLEFIANIIILKRIK